MIKHSVRECVIVCVVALRLNEHPPAPDNASKQRNNRDGSDLYFSSWALLENSGPINFAEDV